MINTQCPCPFLHLNDERFNKIPNRPASHICYQCFRCSKIAYNLGLNMSCSPLVTIKLLMMFKNSGLGSLSMCSPYDVIRDLSFVTCAASGSRDFSIVAKSAAVPASLPRDRSEALASRWIFSLTRFTSFVCYRNRCISPGERSETPRPIGHVMKSACECRMTDLDSHCALSQKNIAG